jgi:hypothetical protein
MEQIVGLFKRTKVKILEGSALNCGHNSKRKAVFVGHDWTSPS